MVGGYLDIAITPSVEAAQESNGSRALMSRIASRQEFRGLTQEEMDFIAARDTFYMATVSETGWPYIQHRGGPPGFLRVLDSVTLAFGDFRGNRQYISLGNLAFSDRAALILMDYPNRQRLKIFARVEEVNLAADPVLKGKLSLPGYKATVERGFLVHVEAFDWNCPQHITPRYTAPEFEAAVSAMRIRLGQLEVENRVLRQRVGDS
jgi:hypothetical protein